jgi:hypothetical protein
MYARMMRLNKQQMVYFSMKAMRIDTHEHQYTMLIGSIKEKKEILQLTLWRLMEMKHDQR